jgi:methionyl-tRNA formyltransferase
MCSVILLTNEGLSGRITASYLAAVFPSMSVFVEQPASRLQLLRRRVRRLGLIQVGGQLAFMAFQKVQQKAMQSRIAAIIRSQGLSAEWPENVDIVRVPSVNSSECLTRIQVCSPKVILVVGTRLIAKEVLDAFRIPFINYHAGITPKYRGTHGGYWANVQRDPDNCGITIHLVDEGIDTGAVLYQSRIKSTSEDNFTTLPYLQLATALPLLERAARDALEGNLRPRKVDLPSGLWSHPTIWSYLIVGLKKGIW